MKRLLVLSPAPFSAASTRYRLAQFFPALTRAGIEPILRPFLDEKGFSVLYRRGAAVEKVAAAIRAAAGRLTDVARSVRADAVLIHREAALVGPPLVEWLLRRLHLPLLFDLDDAVWVGYASPTYGSVLSRLLKAPEKAVFTLGAVDRVIAGNPYIAQYARQFNDRVEVVPTVVDTDVFLPARQRGDRAVPVLGWIGTHSTAQYLQAIVPALQTLAKRRRFIVRVIGGTIDAPGVSVESVPWLLEEEATQFQDLDVGLYPLVEDAWSLGKSGFKAIQYMACGVPTVASPVGVTTEIIRDGDNGFIASTHDEWVLKLEQLIDDRRLRMRLGDSARTDAVDYWSRQIHEPRFVGIVQGVL